MSMNAYAAMQSLEEERREHRAEMSINIGSDSRRRETITSVQTWSARMDSANVNTYLHAARQHAEAMGRPTIVYDSFMELIKGDEDERMDMDIRRRLALFLDGYPAFIKGFGMLLPFVFEDVVRAKL